MPSKGIDQHLEFSRKRRFWGRERSNDLGELIGPEATLPAPWSGVQSRPRRRQPCGQAGLSVRRAVGGEDRRRAFHRGCLDGAPRRSSCLRARHARRPLCRSSEDKDPRRRLALIAARFLRLSPRWRSPLPAPTARPRSLPSCASSGQGRGSERRASVRSAWSARAAQSRSSTPRRTRSSCIAILAGLVEDGVTHLAFEARAMACSSAAQTASPSPRAPSPISRATIWTITRASRSISRQKLRLFRELLPPDAGCVVDVDSEGGESSPPKREHEGLRAIAGVLQRGVRRSFRGGGRRGSPTLLTRR